MNAFILLDSSGRMLRLHQDGIDVRLEIGGQEVLLVRKDRIDLARFLLSGVSTLEPVIEELAQRDHLFEPLPEPAPVEAPKPAHVSDGHAFFGRPADPINIEESVKLPPLKPKGMGRTIVLDEDGHAEAPKPTASKPTAAAAPPQPNPSEPSQLAEPEKVHEAPIRVKEGPSGP